MLINMIGTDEEHVVDLDSWKGEPSADPTERETLAMAVQAAVAAFAVGPAQPTPGRDVAKVGAITAATGERASRVDAA